MAFKYTSMNSKIIPIEDSFPPPTKLHRYVCMYVCVATHTAEKKHTWHKLDFDSKAWMFTDKNKDNY